MHFTGTARLARDPRRAAGATRARPTRPARAAVGRDAVYRVYFHGPAYQVLDQAWREDGASSAASPTTCRPTTSRLTRPTRDRAAADRALLPDRRRLGARDLGPHGPAHACRPRAALRRRRRRRARAGPSSRPRGDGVSDADVVDEDGRVVLRLEGYRTIELPGGARRGRSRADPQGDELMASAAGSPSRAADPPRCASSTPPARTPRRAASRSSSSRCTPAEDQRALDVREADEALTVDPDDAAAVVAALIEAAADAVWIGSGFGAGSRRGRATAARPPASRSIGASGEARRRAGRGGATAPAPGRHGSRCTSWATAEGAARAARDRGPRRRATTPGRCCPRTRRPRETPPPSRSSPTRPPRRPPPPARSPDPRR